MELAALVVAIVLVVILVRRGTAPLGVPTPIALLVVGAALSFVPAVPEVPLSSELVLFGLLPPLLYAAALSTSLLDVRTHRTVILSLSVGLVLCTALGVAVVAWLLLPIPFTLAVALGAIVAPPDAVAATAVARRIGLPRRITTILEGESLLKDATALVTLRTALAAAGLAAHGVGAVEGGESAVPEVTIGSVSIDLVVASLGGVAVGILAYLLITSGAATPPRASTPRRTSARRDIPSCAASSPGRRGGGASSTRSSAEASRPLDISDRRVASPSPGPRSRDLC